MSLIMSAVGFSEVNKMFKEAMPGPVVPWHVLAAAEYSAYVELGTANSRAQPFMRPAVEKAKAEIPELMTKAKDLNDLIRLIALRIEYHAKRFAAVDTGHMKREIKASKL